MLKIFRSFFILGFTLVCLTNCYMDSASFLALLPPRTHKVKAKETVYALSRKYDVPIRTIIEANELQPPYILKKGERLIIPRAQLHKVKKGETLYGIARTYGVDFTALARQNKIKKPWTVSIGQNLYLPATLTKTTYSSSNSATISDNFAEQTNRNKIVKKKQHIALPAPPKRTGKFSWPVQGKIISSYGFSGGGKRNDGINISAKRGTPIKAADNGVIAYVGDDLKGFGNLVLIKHDKKWITAYAHADRFFVKKGDIVKKGQSIGKVGSTGNVKTPQLHFEVRKGTKASNPVIYLKK